MNWFIVLLLIIYVVVPFFIFLLFRVKKKKYDFGNTGRFVKDSIPSVKKIPYNMDVYSAFWICEFYYLYSRRDNFLGVILFKWLKNENIKLKKINKNIYLDKTVVNDEIYLVKSPLEKYELDLYNSGKWGCL